MNWLFLGKTVVSLILVLCGTWYLRRSETEHYSFDTFILVAVLVFFACGIGEIISSSGMAFLQKIHWIPAHYSSTSVAAVFFIVLIAAGVLLISAAEQVRKGKFARWGRRAAPRPVTYGRDDALALKGIAILVMFMHHLYLKGRFPVGTISFAPFSEEMIISLATYCKICVSLFAFISGYGLFLSYRQNGKLTAPKWIAHRYIKTFSGFWIIVVLTWIVCQILNGRTTSIYMREGLETGVVSMLLDLAGLAGLSGTLTMCGTWWYMGAAFVFILLTPLVARKNNSIVLFCLAAFLTIRVITGGKMSAYYETFLSGHTPLPFIMPFLIGALFAKNDLLVRIANAPHRCLRFFLELLLLACSGILYLRLAESTFFDIKWGLLPLPFLLFCIEFVIPCKGLRQVLVFLGRHSMNLFLIHSFVRTYYLNGFLYSLPHFLVIFLVLLLISLALSLLVEWIKKALRYDAFIDKLCDRIVESKP